MINDLINIKFGRLIVSGTGEAVLERNLPPFEFSLRTLASELIFSNNWN